MKPVRILWFVLACVITGCQGPGVFLHVGHHGPSAGQRNDPETTRERLERDRDESDDIEERPGFRRTIVGNVADVGFGLVSFPFLYTCGYPAMFCTRDPEAAQAAVYPFGVVGAFALSAPVVVLKFVLYDTPVGVAWLLTTDKGKVDCYIRNIDDLDESEYLHLVELTGHDLGDVHRHKTLLYSWGRPDRKACARWRAWWKENRRRSLEEIRKRAPEKREPGPAPPARGGEGKSFEDGIDYGYE